MTDRLTAKQQDTATFICEQIVDGKSLRAICRDNDLSQRNFYRWLLIDEDLAQQYTRAREEQADTIFDEILEIADDSTNDFMLDKDGAEAINPENIQRSKLRIDARKWMAGKMRPKKYSDHIRQELSGPDGSPIDIEIQPSSKLAGFLDGIAKRSGETGKPS